MTMNWSTLVGLAFALAVALLLSGLVTGYRPGVLSQAGVVGAEQGASGW